jgi:hypothetical protein
LSVYINKIFIGTERLLELTFDAIKKSFEKSSKKYGKASLSFPPFHAPCIGE